MTRRYDQYCGLAAALELVGDRWTLLIVRELLFLGPRRFSDLADGLPGIAPNLLTTRLRTLQADGLAETVPLPAPARGRAYALTPDGEGLRPAVAALMRWGADHLPDPHTAAALRPELVEMALRVAFDATAAHDVVTTIELVVDGSPLTIAIDRGRLDLRHEPATAPDASIAMPLVVFAGLATGNLDVTAAIADGTVTVRGDGGAIAALLATFGRRPAPPAATGA